MVLNCRRRAAPEFGLRRGFADGDAGQRSSQPGPELRRRWSPIWSPSVRQRSEDYWDYWDFIFVVIALSVATPALIIYCCFHQKCHPWILSCLHPSWQGRSDNRRHLPSTSINSLQRYGAFASRNPQCFPVAESSCNLRFVPTALHREAFVHFRKPSVSKDGSTPLFAATPGSGAGCGPTSETILEMEDEL